MKWIKRWGYEIAEAPSRPGIWRLKKGGYLIGLRVTDSRGRRKARTKALHNASIEEAQRWRDQARIETRDSLRGHKRQRQLFSEFAASLFENKVAARDIKSAKGREKWESTLRLHLLPAFGEFPCIELRHADLVHWRGEQAIKVKNGSFSPRTVNGWLSILRVITAAMTVQLELDRDPSIGLRDFDTSQRPTYTDEEPNTLSAPWAARFLEEMLKTQPQHYPMALLGFVTGKRPSTLRPLRRIEDVDWDEGFIRFRRSNSLGKEIMEGTKTGTRERVYLPQSVMDALRRHLDNLTRDEERESPFLFPSTRGGMKSRSVLDKPFAAVSRSIGLPYRISPRAMRRTFNDLARAANIHDVVTRSISGHLTDKMHSHYSTAGGEEQREAIAKVIRLVDPKPKAVKKAVR